jgi:hypothetical protein
MGARPIRRTNPTVLPTAFRWELRKHRARLGRPPKRVSQPSQRAHNSWSAGAGMWIATPDTPVGASDVASVTRVMIVEMGGVSS